MKHIDYLYFNIYNYFNHAGVCRQSPNARFQAMYLFALGTGGWLLFLQATYLHINHSRFSSRGESSIFAGAVLMLAGILTNYIFIVRQRDLEILEKYESLSDKNPGLKKDFIISLCILLLPYIALLSFAIFSPRYGQ